MGIQTDSQPMMGIPHCDNVAMWRCTPIAALALIRACESNVHHPAEIDLVEQLKDAREVLRRPSGHPEV
jgi:hypothetical protein